MVEIGGVDGLITSLNVCYTMEIDGDTSSCVIDERPLEARTGGVVRT